MYSVRLSTSVVTCGFSVTFHEYLTGSSSLVSLYIYLFVGYLPINFVGLSSTKSGRPRHVSLTDIYRDV